VKRSKPLRVGVEKVRAWQRRSQEQQLAALPSKARRTALRSGRRRDDAAWREACLVVRGERCRVAGCPHPWPVQMDHLIPRAQGGPSVVENGLPLCLLHHQAKTEHRLRIRREWLDPDMTAWLEAEGHARWLLDGTVAGRHCRLFASIQGDES
jgi:5-methylcytosine-specific restriction endonuclease McrA